MTDPSITFDLVHVALSLKELAALFLQGFDFLREAFCLVSPSC